MRISCLFSPVAAAPYRYFPTHNIIIITRALKNIWISGLGKIFITWSRGPGPSRVNLMRISHEYSYPTLTLSVNTSDGDLITDHCPVSSCSSSPGPCSPCSHLTPVSPCYALRSQFSGLGAPPNIILNYPLTGCFSLLSSETLLESKLENV